MYVSGLLLVAFVVGREGVLATAGEAPRCGRRLVSGLFSRPRLPLGYSYVTTVPRGACRLNISEIVPSENYIALKLTNGSYIMNGEFAVSAAGTYEAAGARFEYSRAGGRDHAWAQGPLHAAIDIMILYTQPSPSIKYEYFTESLPGEIDLETVTRPSLVDISTAPTKHIRRHHSYESFGRAKYPDLVSMSKEYSNEDNMEDNVVGTRRFMWKIISFTQCTRTCGGGIQVGKFRCVEANSNNGIDREVSPAHCIGSPPSGRRRRCGNVPCAPRWRAAAWSACPKCGPATRTRIVGCVQDHSRGITKVSDQKCPAPKPTTIEACNIPICNDLNTGVRQVETRRVNRPRDHIDAFQDGSVVTVAVNSSDTVGPEYSFGSAASWLYTEWSECVGWCVGGGVQSRGVRCSDPSGCAPKKSPEVSRSCTPKLTCDPHIGSWFTGEWSACSSVCGGQQVRGVLCIGGSGRHLRDSACAAPRPDHVRSCGEDCTPTWYYGDWGQCTGNCTTGIGIQRRTVWCAGRAGVARDPECTGSTPRPLSQRVCDLACPKDVGESSLAPAVFSRKDSQRQSRNDNSQVFTTQEPTTTTTDTTIAPTGGCEDKLNNCALAVQARLCHYNYYVQNCCSSCRG